MPDNSTAAALAIAVNQGGTATTNAIVLMQPGRRPSPAIPPRADASVKAFHGVRVV
jgi:hypothetical protein